MAIDGLDQIEKLGRDIKESVPNTLEGVIVQISQDVADDLRQSAESTYPQGQASLQNSIGYVPPIRDANGVLTGNIAWADFGEYQDKGVSGVEIKRNTPYSYTDKRPPVDAFRRYTGDKSIAFAISNSIYYKGFEGTGWYSKLLTDRYISELAERAAKIIANRLDNEL